MDRIDVHEVTGTSVGRGHDTRGVSSVWLRARLHDGSELYLALAPDLAHETGAGLAAEARALGV